MYQTHKTYIKPHMKMSDLINENPTLLLLMEYFEIDYTINNKTIDQICIENKVNLSVFLIFSNLYNGFQPDKEEINTTNLDVSIIIKFLKNSHSFYKNEKFPEISQYIKKLYDNQNPEEIKRIENFFNNYFKEVLEHLNYEDEIAFPYFYQLISKETKSNKIEFSVNEYREHHTDIETKLSDLKNLLLKHISLRNDFHLKRKILNSLFELEYDLSTHSMIEEMILLPLVDEIEKRKMNG